MPLRKRGQSQRRQRFIRQMKIRTLQAKNTFRRHAFGKELIVHILHDHAGALHALTGALRPAVPEIIAGPLPVQAAQCPRKAGFACAVASRQRDDFARRRLHKNILQHRPLPIAQRDAAQFQRERTPFELTQRRLFLCQIYGSQAHCPPLRGGQRAKLIRRIIARNASVFQIEHAIRYIHQVVQPMLGYDDGPALRAETPQALLQLANGSRI